MFRGTRNNCSMLGGGYSWIVHIVRKICRLLDITGLDSSGHLFLPVHSPVTAFLFRLGEPVPQLSKHRTLVM